ncbi:MAG TPA: hypothetical protein PKD18_13275 [Saprospiraceae bacterium]|nr:hypothetical protein [Saprospiraceae bacterium]HOY13558.1 hypothetical protein [Saprospiraceae bacterium]HPN68368.1 hypothetical protein [Saprospiraceae bacterium]
MATVDLETIVKYAWLAYDSSREIIKITDISAKVSTNFVFRVKFRDKGFVIAKLSYFGKFEHFSEDHQIIQALGNNLPIPFDNFLAKSLMKNDKLYIHRFTNDSIDAWVIFYQPIKIKQKLPRILEIPDIVNLGKEFANFHKTCNLIRNTLPKSTKTLESDIRDFTHYLHTEDGIEEFGENAPTILKHCDQFLTTFKPLKAALLPIIPVFVDWNIGNFSISAGRFYSRWDYDWFRVSTRMMDFYFIARVVSAVGDRTLFTYNIEPLKDPRFAIFLKEYHQINPLKREEILFIKEAYRFFLINYVLRHGQYFFRTDYVHQLQKDVLDTHLDAIDSFDPQFILDALSL